MEEHLATLGAIETDLQRNRVAPAPNTPAVLDDCYRRLRTVPVPVMPERRIALLIDIASQFYIHGQRVFGGVEPIAHAVMLADQEGDRATLRKALNIQGLILGATNNLTDAISSYMRSLDIAEEQSEPYLVVAIWINIAIAFLDATLFTDARTAFDRALTMAGQLPDSPKARYAAAKAYHGSALASLRLHEYLRGLDAVEEALNLLDHPTDRDQEQTRVLVEATYVRLLLAMHRVPDATDRLDVIQTMAERSRTARAALAAATTRGLVEVFSGKTDLGLSRIASAVDQARSLPGSLYETLQAAALAHERAGQPDRGLSTHRELIMRMRKANQEAIEQHQRLHLARLRLPELDATSLNAMESTDERLRAGLIEMANKQYEFLEQIALRVELREEPSGEHPFRVAAWARMLAIDAGVEPEQAALIEKAARLHDIGKVMIPDSVILKKSALSNGERQIIETHATNGAELLARATSLPYAALAEEIARHHHEHWAGTGYPDGLSGKAIPQSARIVGVCDAFAAMVNDRIYRRAFTVEEALGEVARERGRQFDPELVDLLIPLVRRVYAQHPDINTFLSAGVSTTTLAETRRSVEQRAARAAALAPSPQPGK